MTAPSPSPFVRRLDVGDEEIVAAACRLFDEGGSGSGSFAVEPTPFLRHPSAHLFVSFVSRSGDAPPGNEVAGWAYGHELVHPDGERTMLLYALDVAEPHQRRGHGRALVTAFVGHARSLGCTEVWVLTDDANAAAVATYASAGGRRDPGEQVMFTWPLSPGRESGVGRSGS